MDKKKDPLKSGSLTKENEKERNKNEILSQKKRKKTKKNESAICYAQFGKHERQNSTRNAHLRAYIT